MPPPNTPAEPVGARVARFPTAGSLPRFNGGSASALCVSRPARRLLALWPVWLLSRPRRPFVIGVLQTMLLPLSSAPIATDWSDSCRAGFAPAEDWRLLTAHVESTTGAVAVGRGGSCSRRLSPMPVPHSSPWLRFQSPLVEPDMQISRIRLSDEIMPSHVAPSGFAELHLRLIGFRQSSCSFLRHALLSN